MKKQDKPKMAIKKIVTKVVAKPASKIAPAKVAAKTTKTIVKPVASKPVKKTDSDNKKKYAEQYKIVKETRNAVGNDNKKKLSEMRFDRPYNSNDMTKDYLEAQRLRKKAGLGVAEEVKLVFPQVGQKIRNTVKSMFGSDTKKK